MLSAVPRGLAGDDSALGTQHSALEVAVWRKGVSHLPVKQGLEVRVLPPQPERIVLSGKCRVLSGASADGEALAGGTATQYSELVRPCRLAVEDAGLSSRKPGFESPWGCQTIGDWGLTIGD